MKKIAILLLCIMILLHSAACTAKPDKPAVPSVESEPSALPLNPEPSAASDASSALEDEIPERKSGLVAGVSAENYPDVDGSTANLPLMAKLYSEVCGVSVEAAETAVNASGTSNAWLSLLYSEGDRLLLVYEAPQSVKDELSPSKIPLESNAIGRDGLVFLVNANNPVDNLTLEQLVGIYTGKITDWSEVGGEAGPIKAFQRNESSGSQTMFLKLLMKDTEPMKPPTELVAAMMGGLIDGVAAYDGSGGAIGYSVYYYASEMYRNPDIKIIKVDSVAPGEESIGDGSYPLVNEFFAAIRESTPKNHPARLLRDFLLTDDGKKLIRGAGYVTAPDA